MAILVHTASRGGYDDVTADLAVTIVDDDVPGIVLSPTSLEIQEGRADSYTVMLSVLPSTTITVHIFDQDEIGVLLSSTTLDFSTTDYETRSR